MNYGILKTETLKTKIVPLRSLNAVNNSGVKGKTCRKGNRMMKKIIAAAVLAGMMFVTPVFAGQMMTGGWQATTDTAIDEDAQAAFDAAMEGLLGVEYEPIDLLATQVVAGTNYCFLCRSTIVVPDAVPGYAFVYVYKDLSGKAEILDIQDIEFGAGVFEDEEAMTE